MKAGGIPVVCLQDRFIPGKYIFVVVFFCLFVCVCAFSFFTKVSCWSYC